jgi:hypothetical protein
VVYSVYNSVNTVSKQIEIIEALIAKAGSLRAAARTLGYEPGYICELRKEHKPLSLNFIQAVGVVYPDLIPMLGEYLWGSVYANQDKGKHGDRLISGILPIPTKTKQGRVISSRL